MWCYINLLFRYPIFSICTWISFQACIIFPTLFPRYLYHPVTTSQTPHRDTAQRPGNCPIKTSVLTRLSNNLQSLTAPTIRHHRLRPIAGTSSILPSIQAFLIRSFRCSFIRISRSSGAALTERRRPPSRVSAERRPGRSTGNLRATIVHINLVFSSFR